MAARNTIAGRLILTAVAFGVVLLPQQVISQSQSPQAQVPAFHQAAPRGPVADTLSPSLFSTVVVQNTYALAARIKKILYQQPCYCYCDRSRGHRSLLDCFSSNHGSECGVCLQEALYTYEQSRKGKSAAQIRSGIERGEWQQVDPSKYQSPITGQ